MNIVGDLNNIAKAGWDYISGVAKNISVEGIQNGWNTYVKQSPEELANVARATMRRKESIMNYFDMNKLDEIYSTADKSNADYIEQFNKLRGALNSGNTDEAKTVATSISERFQDGAYLELLQKAEGEFNSNISQINNVPARQIEVDFKNGVKEKLSNSKIANTFLEENGTGRDKIADMAYRLQGKKQYFNTNDPKTNRIRAGVAAGTYMGAMTTARLVHGGGLTTNEYGERDIVGIPFI